MRITMEMIEEMNPCVDRLNNFKTHYPNFDGSLAEFVVLDKISEWDKVWVCRHLARQKDPYYVYGVPSTYARLQIMLVVMPVYTAALKIVPSYVSEFNLLLDEVRSLSSLTEAQSNRFESFCQKVSNGLYQPALEVVEKYMTDNRIYPPSELTYLIDILSK